MTQPSISYLEFQVRVLQYLDAGLISGKQASDAFLAWMEGHDAFIKLAQEVEDAE